MRVMTLLLNKLTQYSKDRKYKLIITVLFGSFTYILTLTTYHIKAGDLYFLKYLVISFPILITLAWGSSYGLLCTATAFLLISPHHLIASHHWGSLIPIINLLLWIILAGKRDGVHKNVLITHLKCLLKYIILIGICLLVDIVLIVILRRNGFSFESATFINQFHGSYGILILQNLLIQVLLPMELNIIMLLPVVQKLFLWNRSRFSRYNSRIIFAVTIYGVFIAFIIILNNSQDNGVPFDFYALWHPSINAVESALLSLCSCFIFGGMLVKTVEGKLEVHELMLHSELNYKRVFDNLNDIYLETELDGRILLVSPSAIRFGYQPEELIGTNIRRLYAQSSDRDQLLQELLRKRELINYELIMIDAGKLPHTIWLHAKIEADFYGQQKILCILRDVSSFIEERRKREETEYNYKQMFDKMINGFIAMEPVYNSRNEIEEVIFTEVNPSFERITGLQKSEIIGRTWQDVFRYKHRYLKEYQEVLNTDQLFEKEVYNPSLKMYFKCSTYKINNNKIGAVFEDITEKKRAEDELQEMVANLKAIFESTEDNIWLVNENFEMIACNEAFVNTVRTHTGVECYHKDYLLEKVPGQLYNKWITLYRRAIENGSFTIEDEYNDSVYEVSFNPIFREGKVAGVSTFGKNITERKTAERRLTQFNKEVEQKVEARTAELKEAMEKLEAFNYLVSHELKSPLRALELYSRILLEDYQSHMIGEMENFTVRIMDISQSMITMTNKLLRYSMMDKDEFYKTTINLNDMIHEAFSEIYTAYPSRRFELLIEEELPPIEANQDLMKSVLDNLISNAVKFTAIRELALIQVRYLLQEDEVVIAISDNGIGFEAEYTDKLFHIFERLHSSEEYEGSGIGLATVRKIIALHGGRTWIEGSLGYGATVYFTLPFTST